MAHAGTFLEFAAPLTLLFVSRPGPLLVVGMIFVLLLHGFIIGNMPAGAVFEWNLVSLYAAFFLFVGHPDVTVLDIDSLPLAVYLVVGLIVLPLVGNLVPARVSFLVAMRYYAGNWAWNAWLFRGDSHRKLDRVKRASPLLREQLERFAPAEAASMDSRGMAFRSLHLQGRCSRPADAEGDRRPTVPGVPLRRRRERRRLGPRLELRRRPPVRRAPAGAASRSSATSRTASCARSWSSRSRSSARRCTGGIVDAKRGVLEEGYARLDELARRAPWDYGEI